MRVRVAPALLPLFTFFLYLSLFFYFSNCVSAADEDDGDVVVLTSDNFESFIQQDIALVEFYAPWCGHCKSLTPEYKIAATELLAADPPVPLGKVDATVENALAGKFQVSGYPTLKIFRNGKASDYNGPRKAAGIVAYMKKQSGPAARPLTSDAELQAFINSDKATRYAVVGFFSSGKSSQLASVFSLLAPRLRDDFLFGKVVDNQELLNKYSSRTDLTEAIIAFSHGSPILYTGTDTKQKSVEDFIRSNSVPLVGELTEENAELYNKRGLPLIKFFMRVDADFNSKNMKYYTNRFKKIAEEVKDRAVVAVLDKTKHKEAVNSYNLEKEDIGCVLENRGKKWKYEAEEDAKAGKMDVEGWKKWVAAVLADDGSVPQYVRSERAPKTQGSVKIVTGSTFDSIVNDPTKDVLIEFYAPWCGHCKALEPKYTELGEKLAKEEGVVIAKIDATANDFDREKWEVSGYPTIYFRAAAKEDGKLPKAVKYEGARETEDMLKYIKKNSRSIRAARKEKKKAEKQ